MNPATPAAPCRRQWLQAASAGLLLGLPGLPRPWRPKEMPATSVGLLGDAQRKVVESLLVQFARAFEIPGLSLAMGYRGELKLMACCGWSDQEQQIAVAPHHTFRIASVSKPLTAAALLQHAGAGELDLAQPLFGTGGTLSAFYDTAATRDPQQRRWQEMLTTDQLLHHTGGGWGNARQDPMFRREWLNLDHRELIAQVLQHQPLEHEPGSQYAYSNFGYCLLGRLLETLGQDSYEKLLQGNLLAPAGATQMRVALPEPRDRLPHEVRYYQTESDPYGAAMRVRRMDSHGGWVAAPYELVRVGARLDGRPDPDDSLPAPQWKRMRQGSQANANYACGWSRNRQGNLWHFGSLPGTYSFWALIGDGHVWSLFANTRGKRQQRDDFNREFDALPWNILREVGGKWARGDLSSPQF